MRRAHLAMTAAVSVLAIAACGGDDGSDNADGGDEPAVDVTTPETTPPEPPVAVEECEDTPDPADYPEGETPRAARPCEIPEALFTHTIRSGAGRNAQDGDTLIVDYVGMRSVDGAIFDESYSRGVPTDFVVGRGDVVRGWDDGLIATQAGALVKVDIPAELAYGDNPPPSAGDVGIEPGDALSFVVEVHAIIPPVTAADAPLELQLDPSVGATDVTVTVLEEGDGAVIEPGDTAVVHLLLVRGDNQVVLFNTWANSDPLQIIVRDGETLPGVIEALDGARVGSMIAVAMPPADAFGDEGNPGLGLPAGTDLIAVIEIVGVY